MPQVLTDWTGFSIITTGTLFRRMFSIRWTPFFYNRGVANGNKQDFNLFNLEDSKPFNKALLGKQAWRLFQDPLSLWSWVFKGLYFPSKNFWHADRGNRPSWGWQSLPSEFLEGQLPEMNLKQWLVLFVLCWITGMWSFWIDPLMNSQILSTSQASYGKFGRLGTTSCFTANAYPRTKSLKQLSPWLTSRLVNSRTRQIDPLG